MFSDIVKSFSLELLMEALKHGMWMQSGLSVILTQLNHIQGFSLFISASEYHVFNGCICGMKIPLF